MKKLIVLGGPTAVGKTDASLMLVEKYGGVVVNADSRQIYRYMDIGTDKVSAAIQGQVPHYLLDVRTPDEPFSAGMYAQAVDALLPKLWQKTPYVWVVGGTGFYLKALVEGLDAVPTTPPEVRRHLQKRLDREGLPSLVEELKKVEPAATLIDLKNPRRVLRSLEVYYATGRPLSAFWQGKKKTWSPEVEVLTFWLDKDIRDLRYAIEKRTHRQLREGWIEETESLLRRGYVPTMPGLQTLGYREIIAFLRGKLRYKDLSEAITCANVSYARRQKTWFRGQKGYRYVSDVKELAYFCFGGA
ncbi:MAG: tRNA (adenosine(37)-N6)-dimethylallyltransferase MiaA [Bacteroidia bacterium]